MTKEVKQRTTEYIKAFMVPAFLFLMMCLVLKIAPFGDRTFLYADNKIEYPGFYGWYSRALRGEDSLLYSDTCGLGCNMFGLWAFYLSSPFLLLLPFIPGEAVPVFATFMIGAKISLCGLTFRIMLEHTDIMTFFTGKDSAGPGEGGVTAGCMPVIFSTAYAFSGCLIFNCVNSMWVDPLVILPITFMFCMGTVSGKKHAETGYIISFFLMIIANYYISYMALLFMGMFVLILLISGLISLKGFKRCVLWTCLGLVSVSWYLYPVYRSLSGTNKSHSSEIVSVLGSVIPVSESAPATLTPADILPKLLLFSYDTNELWFGKPQIYFGCLLILPLIIFFVSDRIKTRVKAAVLVFVAVIFMFFCIPALNLLAHGMTEPYGYNYRDSFVMSFTCIISAYAGASVMGRTSGKRIRAAVVIEACIFAVCLAVRPGYMGVKKYAVNLVLLAAGTVLWLLYVLSKVHKGETAVKRKNAVNGRAPGAVIGVMVLAELILNFYYMYVSSSVNATGFGEYRENYTLVRDALSELRAKADPGDMENYRIEEAYASAPNDGMRFGFNGITAYHSLVSVSNRVLLYRLGFNDNGLYAGYMYGNTRTADAILGIRYILDTGESITPTGGQIRITDKVLMNRTALSRDAVVTGNTSKLLAQLSESGTDEDNPFMVQEYLYNSLSGKNVSPFVPARIIRKDSGAEEGRAVYEVEACADGAVYLYIPEADTPRNLGIYIDGAFITGYGNASCQKVIRVFEGECRNGDRFILETEWDDGLGCPAEPLVVSELPEVL